MKTAAALWKLLRLEHGVMLFMAILIGAVIAEKGMPSLVKLVFAFLTAMLLEASTFALNDYFDYEIDKKNKRYDRPLVGGNLSPRTALYLFYVLFPLGIIAAWMVNITCFLIALVTGLLSVLYDARLKRLKLVGNFYIAYIMAVPFIFGGTVVSPRIPSIIVLIAFIAFLAGAGREIMKDVMDFHGDRAAGVKSLPLYIGLRNARIVAGLFYLLAVGVSIIPFAVQIDAAYYYDYVYLLLVGITDVMLVGTSLALIFKPKVDIGFHRKATLGAIFIGLVAFLAGAFVV